ncbi:Uncharacterised protein [Streptococcus pneumoniae]|nr:Uncharacterised protein [Streptococcus pneumoniae]
MPDTWYNDCNRFCSIFFHSSSVVIWNVIQSFNRLFHFFQSYFFNAFFFINYT